jgi:hypothetical protein
MVGGPIEAGFGWGQALPLRAVTSSSTQKRR